MYMYTTGQCKRRGQITQNTKDVYLPHSTAQLLICHARVVLFAAPHLCNCLGLHKPEHPGLFILPAQKSRVKGGIFQQIADEFP